jgi:hypothetical protein
MLHEKEVCLATTILALQVVFTSNVPQRVAVRT